MRVLHKNLLMQCDCIPFEGSVIKPKRRTRRERNVQKKANTAHADSSSESEDLIIEPATRKSEYKLNPEVPGFKPGGTLRPGRLWFWRGYPRI